jgi:hypothetical protein
MSETETTTESVPGGTVETSEQTVDEAAATESDTASPETTTATETTGEIAPAASPDSEAPLVATLEPEGEDYTPEELVRAMEASLRDFKDGDIMEGVVVKIDRDEILLDIGYKSEGVIPSKELSIRHDVDPNEVVKVGDRI